MKFQYFYTILYEYHCIIINIMLIIYKPFMLRVYISKLLTSTFISIIIKHTLCNVCFISKRRFNMPPKALFSREEIIEAAVEIVKQEGFQALTARALGAKLGTSSSPIFTKFQSIDEVQQEVLKSANQLYQSYLKEDMESKEYPPYKASGMAYIRFAKENKELFKLLFMRDRSHEKKDDNKEEIKPLIELIQKNTGLSEEKAYLLHLEIWIYVHGIATMIATSYLEWDMEFVSQSLTDAYLGLKHRFCK